jgi:hypothetical protein
LAPSIVPLFGTIGSIWKYIYIYIYTYMYRNICVCLQVVCSTVCRTKAIKVSHRSCEETLGTIHGHTLRNAI